MNVLFSVPEAFLQRVLTEWLSVNDVAKLDGAYITKTLRPQLLAMMSNAACTSPIYRNCTLIFPKDWEGVYTRNVHYFSWLVARKMLIDKANIPLALSALKTVSAAFLALQVPKLECITFTGLVYAPSTTLPFLTLMSESCRELQDLTLSEGFQINATFLTNLSRNCPNLRKLAFIDYSIYSDINEVSCAGLTFPSLSAIEAQYTTITDGVVRVLVQGAPLLQHILLTDAPQLTEISFHHIATYAHSLKSLELVNVEVSDELLIPILTANTGLTKLVLEVADEAEITDALITTLCDSCKGLTHFDIYNAWELTNTSLHTLADSCSELTEFHIRNNAHYTNAAVQRIATQCRLLSNVTLFDCPEVKQEALGYFGAHVQISHHNSMIPFWL